MPVPIDLNRGVSMRIVPHGTGPMAGSAVCMYKDAPGLYYAKNGIALDPELAKTAGFDVDGDLKEKARMEKRAAALAAIDQSFGVMPEGEVIQEDADFQIVHMGHGWFDVLDVEGARLNEGRMRREHAVEFVDALRKGKEHVHGQTPEGRQGSLTR